MQAQKSKIAGIYSNENPKLKKYCLREIKIVPSKLYSLRKV